MTILNLTSSFKFSGRDLSFVLIPDAYLSHGNYDSTNLGNLLLSYSGDLKGVTVYREGSRGEEPLKRIDWKSMSKEELNKLIYESEENVSENKCKTGVCEL